VALYKKKNFKKELKNFFKKKEKKRGVSHSLGHAKWG